MRITRTNFIKITRYKIIQKSVKILYASNGHMKNQIKILFTIVLKA